MSSYKVIFEIDNAEIYLVITDSKGTIVFHEMATNNVLSVAERYMELLNQ